MRPDEGLGVTGGDDHITGHLDRLLSWRPVEFKDLVLLQEFGSIRGVTPALCEQGLLRRFPIPCSAQCRTVFLLRDAVFIGIDVPKQAHECKPSQIHRMLAIVHHIALLEGWRE
jgi:hypothetical protein